MKSKNLICAFLLIIFAAVCVGAGFFLGKIPTASAGQDGQMLNIKVSPQDNSVGSFTAEDLGNQYDSISYSGVSDLTISIDGKSYALDKAIREGYISVEEICAYARMDARNGFCRLDASSQHGVTHFTYVYAGYDLTVAYDLYETPDGKQHLIDSLSFYEHNGHRQTTYGYTDPDSEYNYALDRENWGLDITVANVTGTELNVHCVQSGGQQLGTLKTSGYMIVARTDSGTPPPSTVENTMLDENTVTSFEIKANNTTDFTIDLSGVYVPLEKGEYMLILYVTDDYDHTMVHPLIQKYYDIQNYCVPFTVS